MVTIELKRRHILLMVFCLAALAPGLSAQDANPGADLPATRTPPYYRYFDIKPGLKSYGLKADATLGFRLFDGVDTALWVRAEAAYKFSDYYRTPDNSLFRQDLFPGLDVQRTALQKTVVLWGLGVQQGLFFDPGTDRDNLTVLLSWRGAWTNPVALDPAGNPFGLGNRADSLLAGGTNPGKDWLVLNSFQVDLRYDGTSLDKQTKVPAGLWTDASLEYAPPGISAPATTNYLQLNATGRGFLPLYSLVNDQGWNLIGLYLAGQVTVDWIAGLGTDATRGIPYPVSQRFGGRSYQEGLGGTVRGLGDGWADGSFKAAGNLELRCNLPAIFRQDILFGALLFTDAGYFSNPPGSPNGAALNSGAFLSTGLGIYLDVLDLGYLSANTTFVLNATNYRAKQWQPISFEFGLHF